MFRFVGAFDWNADVFGLFFGQLGQFGAELGQMQRGNFFVKLLGQTVNADFTLRILGDIDLRQGLVGEAA